MIVADLVLGSFLVMVLASAAVAAGSIAGSAQTQREATRVAAREAARSGDIEIAMATARRLAPSATVTFDIGSDQVKARSSRSVTVPHPLGHLDVVVSGAATVPIAPYRSNRG